jgi:hypothetical protein
MRLYLYREIEVGEFRVSEVKYYAERRVTAAVGFPRVAFASNVSRLVSPPPIIMPVGLIKFGRSFFLPYLIR